MPPPWTGALSGPAVEVNPADVARYLGLSTPGFQRRLLADRFTRDHRSKLLRLATVLERAQRVLGGRARAVTWVTSNNRALGFSPPLALMGTRPGAARLLELLLRIETGRFA